MHKFLFPSYQPPPRNFLTRLQAQCGYCNNKFWLIPNHFRAVRHRSTLTSLKLCCLNKFGICHLKWERVHCLLNMHVDILFLPLICFLTYSPFPHPNIINTVERLRSEIDGFSKLVDWKCSMNEISRTEASSNRFHLLCLPSFTNLMPMFL